MSLEPTSDDWSYQRESARNRLERAAVQYVAARSGPTADVLFLATVELDRACHAMCVALSDTGLVCMPTGEP